MPLVALDYSSAFLGCRDGAAQLQSELQSLEQQEGTMRKQLEHKEKRLQAVEQQIQDLQHKIQEHKAELSTQLHNHLSGQEKQELADLAPRLNQLQVSLADKNFLHL